MDVLVAKLCVFADFLSAFSADSAEFASNIVGKASDLKYRDQYSRGMLPLFICSINCCLSYLRLYLLAS